MCYDIEEYDELMEGLRQLRKIRSEGKTSEIAVQVKA